MKEYIYGRSVVKEAIIAKRTIFQMFIQEGNVEMIAFAKSHQQTFKVVSQKILSQTVDGLHQGVVAEVESYRYIGLEDILHSARQQYPLILVLDGIEDPHNLGAILRTCDASGVDGVIIPKNRSVGLNSTVAKVSTGAIEHVKVCEVTNITQTLKTLKEKGYWVVGAELTDKSRDYRSVSYDMPVALILGSEGKGISRLVLEQCDFIVQIPMFGHVNSLNVSVSCGIIIYEIIKYRKE